MNKLSQHEAPLMDALVEYLKKGIIPFDVPGHKHGKGNPYLQEILGTDMMRYDINSKPDLDQRSQPKGVIKDAQQLLAEAYGADAAFFMLNGTTSSVQTMLLSTLSPNEKIIIPRNVHKSAMNALIFTGAMPVFMEPEIHPQLKIPTTVTVETVLGTIDEHPDAKALFLINPSYWGFCADLKQMIDYAHEKGMVVLVDEAHGSHFAFHENLPNSAISQGADMSGASMHKTGGSLTQSSILLVNETRVNVKKVAETVNMLQSTSASYLLMGSLDVARKNLVLHGQEQLGRIIELTKEAKNEINKIPGLYAYGHECIGENGVYAVDETKLGINVSGLGVTGFQVYQILRETYKIQLELGDVSNVLAIVSLGDDERTLRALTDALKEISAMFFGMVKNQAKEMIPTVSPVLEMTPRAAYYAEKESIEISESVGRIAGESIMAYPPGIPVIAPGEIITHEIVNYLQFLKENNANLIGAMDTHMKTITVIKTAEG